MKKVAIFARVSTKDKQDYTRQVNELTEYCQAQNWEIVQTITEKVSGSKKTEERPEFQKLLKLAEDKKIQKVVVSEVSRFSRKTVYALQDIERLKELKVSLHIMNYKLDTLSDNGRENVMGQFLVTLLLDIARMERLTTIERIKSGLDEARRKGKTLGRPAGSTKDSKEILKEYKRVEKELKTGTSIRKTAKICEVSAATVQKVKKAMTAS